MKYYEIVECANFDEFMSGVDNYINRGWIFRGHKKDSWELQHRFERACDRLNVFGGDRTRVESNMIREFKRRLHHYTTNTPARDATDEWLALMQHHGTPTRLLDFTYSPYVATYFAFEYAEAESNVAIWAINNGWFSEQLKHREIKDKYTAYRSLREEYGSFNDIFMRPKPVKLILSVNPFRLNERLAYQRGLFLCPGDVSASMEENLAAYGDNDKIAEHIIQFTIPTGLNNKHTIEVLEHLDTMNISRITLFPGLDGFAQSLEPRINSLFLGQGSDENF
ncbi:FRG domain-containing protein [Chloroflexota bacterium]